MWLLRQWWSILSTHFLQTEQWWALNGFTLSHGSHLISVVADWFASKSSSLESENLKIWFVATPPSSCVIKGGL